jgi:LysR family transcriptional activator of nhaA
VRLVCVEDDVEPLLARLALHQLDVILADAPPPKTVKLPAFSHCFKRCGVTFVASPRVASPRLQTGGRFPRLLDRAPLLMPESSSSFGNALARWFAARDLHPEIVGEFSSSSQLEAFGEGGAGIFAIPSLIERELCARSKLTVLGRTQEVVQEFYAFTSERHGATPQVAAMLRGEDKSR